MLVAIAIRVSRGASASAVFFKEGRAASEYVRGEGGARRGGAVATLLPDAAVAAVVAVVDGGGAACDLRGEVVGLTR